MSDQLTIRNMDRAEVNELVKWAAKEGWNPGLSDADIFWQTDPEAYIAAELDGVLIGGGAITTYAGEFGFMGFFIVKPEFRGRGLGDTLWHARKDRLLQRLNPGAAIGMDGVFNMQPYYAKGGFAFSHRNIRFMSTGKKATTDTGIKPLSEIAFQVLEAYDRHCFPAARPTFLNAWINQTDSLALACEENNQLQGYGVIRRCREGCKIGPLFADNQAIADKLYNALAAYAPGEPVYLDVPENNPDAMALAKQHGMQEVFGCARMYLGKKPDTAEDKIFGVTTFELG